MLDQTQIGLDGAGIAQFAADLPYCSGMIDAVIHVAHEVLTCAAA